MCGQGRNGSCRTCWWLSDEFTSVCVNDRSSHHGDFVDLDGYCVCYDEDERRVEKLKGANDGEK